MSKTSPFAKMLFEWLDLNQNSTISFFELIYGLDGLNSLDFKERFKALFELYSNENHRIPKARLLKFSKDVPKHFAGVVLPKDFVLQTGTKVSMEEGDSTSQDKVSIASQRDMRRKASHVIMSRREVSDDVGVDEFYDNFAKIFPLI